MDVPKRWRYDVKAGWYAMPTTWLAESPNAEPTNNDSWWRWREGEYPKQHPGTGYSWWVRRTMIVMMMMIKSGLVGHFGFPRISSLPPRLDCEFQSDCCICIRRSTRGAAVDAYTTGTKARGVWLACLLCKTETPRVWTDKPAANNGRTEMLRRRQ